MERGSRKSHRFAPSPEGEHGVLRIEEQNVPVRVLDESAGGYGILLDEPPGPEAGQTVVLGTHDGGHEVRVVYVREQDKGIRLGCERLSDVVAPPEASDPGSDVPAPEGTQTGVSPIAILCGLLFVGLVCVAVWGWSSMHRSDTSTQDGVSQEYQGVDRPKIPYRRMFRAPANDADGPDGDSNVGSEQATTTEDPAGMKRPGDADEAGSPKLSD